MSRGQNKLGQDLRATDIHRSRERGIASYNKYRVYCGLRKASKWKDFLDYISPEVIQNIKTYIIKLSGNFFLIFIF